MAKRKVDRTHQRKHDYDAVLAAWRELDNQHAVAARLGMPLSTVGDILRRGFGIEVGKGRHTLSPLPMDEVASRYLAGETCRQIAADLGVDQEMLRRRMARAGIARRPSPRAGSGPQNPQWKGGKTQTMHYYRRQSYEVAAICLGQPLAPGWVIHHLDEDPTNNAPENLLLFPSQGPHAHYHQQLLKTQRQGLAVDAILLAKETGGQVLPRPPHPIVLPRDTGARGPSGSKPRPTRPRTGSKRPKAASGQQRALPV